ncbi:uncharacterized protein LOC135146811 [Daucus carota subsp. sativus]|uniref:uncharacterized protein LOC135146811 n=1 Tax=Daucus carota subsp. sativus TaxID=79200 RepID=UPI003082C576
MNMHKLKVSKFQECQLLEGNSGNMSGSSQQLRAQMTNTEANSGNQKSRSHSLDWAVQGIDQLKPNSGLQVHQPDLLDQNRFPLSSSIQQALEQAQAQGCIGSSPNYGFGGLPRGGLKVKDAELEKNKGSMCSQKNNNRERKQQSSSGPTNSKGKVNTMDLSPKSPVSTHTPGDEKNTASSPQHVSIGQKGLMMYGSETAGLASPENQLGLELWNIAENKIMTVRAHENMVAALAQSTICCILCIIALVSLVMTANTENLEVDDGSRDKNLDTKTFHEIKVAFAFLQLLEGNSGNMSGSSQQLRAQMTNTEANSGNQKSRSHSLDWAVQGIDQLKPNSGLQVHQPDLLDQNRFPLSSSIQQALEQAQAQGCIGSSPNYGFGGLPRGGLKVKDAELEKNKGSMCSQKNNNRERKQQSSSGPTNSKGKGNTMDLSPKSPVSTHTPGDEKNTASSPQHVSIGQKGLTMYGSETAGLASPENQLGLKLWNIAENKIMTVRAHENMVAALAQSPVTGMIASGSHDSSVKLWK